MPYAVRIRLISAEPLVLVNFTGTVVESLVVRALGDPALHDAKPKPFSVTPLFLQGRPVADRAAVPPGVPLEFRAGFADGKLAFRLIEALNGGLELFGRRVEVVEAEFRDVFSDPLPTTQCFKAEFLTPTRFATPPLYRRSRPVFDFMPRPLTLFKSAVRHGRSLGLLRLGAPFLKWVYTYVALTDFGCFGKCVQTVRLPNGGVARGFTGWALYRAFGKRRLADMWRVLRLMEAFNVGTGRGMGLGVVKITPLECPRQ
ncbi:MAG: CRISPR-associated endoribonuclease Cas6 [Thermoproteus sp.]